ncbi:hypothetical protein D3C87_1596230 [compost metagenome]
MAAFGPLCAKAGTDIETTTAVVAKSTVIRAGFAAFFPEPFLRIWRRILLLSFCLRSGYILTGLLNKKTIASAVFFRVSENFL